ncbi:alpha/beta fold hydrolase [Nonlabens ulvanivorans]|uniref:alpha/beta fold hydrolase n=1 Tax=Nonlabens ulvanivorans TaxID=906888 RepID=UPI0029421AAE|nr:alpha/beta hydrolase [Nonlabens ulvanivorans]WOI22935.1 alpha/beta hydrolase [Nonlabens ulvanivorans]
MRLLFFFLLGLLFLSSCKSLQYRLPDEAIYSAFAKADIPTSISYVEIDSLDLKVRVQSVTQGLEDYNLVFLHGSPSSLTAWQAYLKDSTLRHTVKLHAIDRPGYGYSNFGKQMISIDTQTKVISEVINQLNLKNVIAIGTSYGGPVAARLPIENDHIKAVVMVSPAIDPDNEKRVWQSDFTQWWLTRWLVPTGYRVAGDEKTVHAQELAAIEKDWSQVNVPVMHIHGDRDELVPFINVAYSQSVFSNVEVVPISGLGHEIAWARPELVIPYLLEMIKKIKQTQ